ncbi:hypothetical protein GGH92_005541, partial [Coemansia sp. RSA 2673]
HPHHFLGVTKSGLAAITVTRGNPLCHIILRGGNSGPNYEEEWVSKISEQILKAKVVDNIMVDCSHGNSSKDHRNQPKVCSDIARQVSAGNRAIVGVMIESNIVEGRQNIPTESEGGLKALTYGQSITDACVSWEQTIPMLQELAQAIMTTQLPQLQTIELTLHEPGVLVMAFNRPSRMNSMVPESYSEWKQVMEFTANTPAIRVLIITGNGRAYSAGQDLSIIPQSGSEEDEAEDIRRRNEVTRGLTRLLITSRIPIIAAVNGPAIGYGCTTLALCDLVISVESAVFRTPFAELAFCAEGCSSVTFPRILGPMVANDMILFGRAVSAAEMHQRGLVSRIVKSEELMPVALKVATTMAKQSQTAIGVSRALIRNQSYVDELVRANDAEMDQLYLRMLSKDAKQAIAQMFARLQATGSNGRKSKI